jgi:hypothetical protein
VIITDGEEESRYNTPPLNAALDAKMHRSRVKFI